MPAVQGQLQFPVRKSSRRKAKDDKENVQPPPHQLRNNGQPGTADCNGNKATPNKDCTRLSKRAEVNLTTVDDLTSLTDSSIVATALRSTPRKTVVTPTKRIAAAESVGSSPSKRVATTRSSHRSATPLTPSNHLKPRTDSSSPETG